MKQTGAVQTFTNLSAISALETVNLNGLYTPEDTTLPIYSNIFSDSSNPNPLFRKREKYGESAYLEDFESPTAEESVGNLEPGSTALQSPVSSDLETLQVSTERK